MGELDLVAGAVIGDDRCSYRLGRVIGEGGMGVVWQATDVHGDKPYALKILKGGKAEDRKRFQREVRAAAAIQHPNVITVHDFVELPNGVLVIVMDLLDGETLGAILRRDGRLSLAHLGAVLVPVLGALDAAHSRGIVHRDLKPDNVFLCRTASGLDVRVLDFGVAKLTANDGLAAQTQALTGTGSMVGTPYYMSPEQVFADKDLDARADIWSLGVIMYECVTGVRPTEADTVGRVLKRIMTADIEPITKHAPDLPEEVASLIGRMLSGDREKRPQSLGEIREVLERHKGDRLPRVSDVPAAQRVDPHAATVPTPEEGPRPPASVPDPALAAAAMAARTDTSDAVSLAARPAAGRKRVVVAVSLAAVAVAGGTLSLGRTNTHDAGMTAALAPISRSAEPSTPLPPAPKEATESAPSATIAPSASSAAPVASAPRVVAASASPPVVSPPPPVARVDAGPRTGVSCEASEVVSNGHCCPRGLVWQFGRCERPFATSF